MTGRASGRLWRASNYACVAICCAAAQTRAAPEASVSYDVVALTGEPAPGSQVYDSFTPPVINEGGNVAFMGRNTANYATVWFAELQGSTYSVFNVLQRLDFVRPKGLGVGPTFYSPTATQVGNSLGRPVLSNNNHIAVIGTYDGNPEYGCNPACQNIIITSETPQAVYRIDAIDPFAFINVFAMTNLLSRTESNGQVSPPDEGEIGNYYISNSQTELADGKAHLTQTRDDATGSRIAWYAKTAEVKGRCDPPCISEVKVEPGGIWCAPSETNHFEIVREEDFIDGWQVGEVPVDTDNAFTVHTMSDGGGVAFAVKGEIDPDPAVWMIAHYDDSFVRHIVAREGDADAPGAQTGVKFSNLEFAPVINEADHVAFRAQTDAPGDKWGVWATRGATNALENVAYDGDTAPSISGGTFTRFGDPVINDADNLAFVGRYEHLWEGQTTESDGIFRATASNTVSRIASRGLGTPQAPNDTAFIGEFDNAFGDPSMNDNDNVVFIADVNISHAGYLANLYPAGETHPSNIKEEALFATDGDGVLRAIVSTGMTLADLDGGSDNRVIMNLEFLTETGSTIGADNTLEGAGSGHQDGRSIGMTNLYTEITENPNGSTTTCKTMRVAVLADFWNYSTATDSTGVIVAELEVCDTQGGGSGCSTCLCSNDPNCMMGSMALGSGPDFDQNGIVDEADLNLTIQAVGYTTGRFDLNVDGIVDATDVAIVYDAMKVESEEAKSSN